MEEGNENETFPKLICLSAALRASWMIDGFLHDLIGEDDPRIDSFDSIYRRKFRANTMQTKNGVVFRSHLEEILL